MITINDLCYSDDKKRLEQICFNCAKDVNIEDSVEIIEESVFANTYIFNLKFPKNLKEIRCAAFEGSTIKNVCIENKILLENFAFANNYSLETIDINCNNIPKWCFTGCGNHTESEKGLKVILKNTQVISEDAFCNCTINKISLPDTLAKVEQEAFKYVHFLDDVLKLPNKIKIIERNAFQNSNLKHIYLPESIEYISNLQYVENLTIHMSPKTFKRLRIEKTDNIAFFTVEELLNAMSFKEINKYFLNSKKS